MKQQISILGAGIAGLAAGFASGVPIYEAEGTPGGICSSYYIRPGETQRLPEAPNDGEVYHFEIGGGHWIHCNDVLISSFIRSLAPVKSYFRRSSVYFREKNIYVSYPLQNNIGCLGADITKKVLKEIASPTGGIPKTMADWLEKYFGKTLGVSVF